MDLKAKISLVLGLVILPTFLLVTVVENQLTHPLLSEDLRQIGINSAKTLAAEIVTSRLLSNPNPTAAIESRIQNVLFAQPNIVRVDVLVRDQITGLIQSVGSNFEPDEGDSPAAVFPWTDVVSSEFRNDDNGNGLWEIAVPIEQWGRDFKSPKKTLGNVRLAISMKLVDQIVSTLWRITATGAAFSVVALFLVLSFFLRKAISNDRKLLQAENQNLQLSQQLHEAQRQVMNTEKLAVLGQLTASFAHEIGTPLNAIGGHLQLLREEVVRTGVEVPKSTPERFDLINGQVEKIALIVKGFLQRSAKPVSQTQLVDLNQILEKSVSIVRPRIDSMGVEVRRKLDRTLGPLRVVPMDLEQVFLNLLNNSLDSLSAKTQRKERPKLLLEVSSHLQREEGAGVGRIERL